MSEEIKRKRGQRGPGKGVYRLTSKALKQRKRASAASAKSRASDVKWKCISVTEQNYFWAVHRYGSVNNALTELHDIENSAAKKTAKKEN